MNISPPATLKCRLFTIVIAWCRVVECTSTCNSLGKENSVKYTSCSEQLLHSPPAIHVDHLCAMISCSMPEHPRCLTHIKLSVNIQVTGLVGKVALSKLCGVMYEGSLHAFFFFTVSFLVFLALTLNVFLLALNKVCHNSHIFLKHRCFMTVETIHTFSITFHTFPRTIKLKCTCSHRDWRESYTINPDDCLNCVNLTWSGVHVCELWTVAIRTTQNRPFA